MPLVIQKPIKTIVGTVQKCDVRKMLRNVAAPRVSGVKSAPRGSQPPCLVHQALLAAGISCTMPPEGAPPARVAQLASTWAWKHTLRTTTGRPRWKMVSFLWGFVLLKKWKTISPGTESWRGSGCWKAGCPLRLTHANIAQVKRWPGRAWNWLCWGH